uniref:Transforming growth factor, beta-induced n=1 Tax=Eptatretus burgeri TaxID=7764 RepID=A0A8C4QGM4_EPTBU
MFYEYFSKNVKASTVLHEQGDLSEPMSFPALHSRAVTYECCPGFLSVDAEKGCSAALPLTTVYRTLENVNAKETKTRIDRTDLMDDLNEPAVFTLFALTNSAWNKLTQEQKRLINTDKKLHNTLLQHVARERLLVHDLRDGLLIPSMLGNHDIHVQQHRNGVVTVNCIRVVTPNLLASNGVVHLVDGLLNAPQSRLTDIVKGRRDLSKFLSLIEKAGLIDVLNKRQGYTLLAPTNSAFGKMDKAILDRISEDSVSLTALIKHHMIPSEMCSPAIIGTNNLETVEGSAMRLGCEGDSVTVNGEPVMEQTDTVATNGVLHTINRVIIPDSAKTVLELAETPHLKTFTSMFKKMNLQASFKPKTSYTLLAPVNEAFEDTTVTDMSEDTTKLLKNHVVLKQYFLHQLHHGQVLKTIGGKNLRVFIYSKTICIENSCSSLNGRKGRYGALFTLRKVLQVPTKSLITTLKDDPRFSILVELIKIAKLVPMLNKGGPLTFFAPTNKAFTSLPPGELDKLKGDVLHLRSLLKYHMFNKVVVSDGISPGVTSFMTTMQGGSLELAKKNNTIFINKNVKLLVPDKMATNGVIHGIDSFFQPKDVTTVNTKIVKGKTTIVKTIKTFGSVTSPRITMTSKHHRVVKKIKKRRHAKRSRVAHRRYHMRY